MTLIPKPMQHFMLVSHHVTPCTAYDVLDNDQPLAEHLFSSETFGSCPHLDLSVAEMALAGHSGRSRSCERLKSDLWWPPFLNTQDDKLITIRLHYYRLSPSLGLLSLSTMAAVDEVLLPPTTFPCPAWLSKLLETIELSASLQSDALLGWHFAFTRQGALAAEVGRDVESFFTEAKKGTHHGRTLECFRRRFDET